MTNETIELSCGLRQFGDREKHYVGRPREDSGRADAVCGALLRIVDLPVDGPPHRLCPDCQNFIYAYTLGVLHDGELEERLAQAEAFGERNRAEREAALLEERRKEIRRRMGRQV